VTSSLARFTVRFRCLPGLALLVAFLPLLNGCSRLNQHPQPEMVYVFAEQTYLRDRVAPVANRVASVSNGEPLQVVEHGRRFVRVKTAQGEVGWIEDHLVIDQGIYDQFTQLAESHRHDPVVARGILADPLYLHLKPGRETQRFYLLPENDKVQLLVRASVPKPVPGAGFLPPPKPAPRAAKNEPEGAPPLAMEDWWLVRDSHGHAGWLLARRLDVDVPDEVAQYSESQKMVGAYVLTHVYDPASNIPDKQVPIYLTVLNPYKDGLPYDFNQIRVFTWNLKKHRYETAYRQRDLEGYLPVQVTEEKVDGATPVPVFSVRVATSDAVTTDPSTGAARPAASEMLRFALEGQMVKKLSAPGAEAAVAASHPLRRRRAKRVHRHAGHGGG
jgi:hypothetical protein